MYLGFLKQLQSGTYKKQDEKTRQGLTYTQNTARQEDCNLRRDYESRTRNLRRQGYSLHHAARKFRGGERTSVGPARRCRAGWRGTALTGENRVDKTQRASGAEEHAPRIIVGRKTENSHSAQTAEPLSGPKIGRDSQYNGRINIVQCRPGNVTRKVDPESLHASTRGESGLRRQDTEILSRGSARARRRKGDSGGQKAPITKECINPTGGVGQVLVEEIPRDANRHDGGGKEGARTV
ncbi:hypothetical protein B0H16DRAFT_1465522 [Mycena metata]|uniref:Uncharacterized protein n=1 Tax=Mycena metata TaxID=1033252 RepID=A0AAD7ICH3_9AGAR|nr:hypothetical protein B0H16DRAFT_1465522 [Mycena metata]